MIHELIQCRVQWTGLDWTSHSARVRRLATLRTRSLLVALESTTAHRWDGGEVVWPSAGTHTMHMRTPNGDKFPGIEGLSGWIYCHSYKGPYRGCYALYKVRGQREVIVV